MATLPEPWFRVNRSEFEKQEHSEIDGVQINVFMSPYDVPEAVRGSYDADSRVFKIEFKYLDQEKAVDKSGGKHVTLQMGKNSGRLFGIRVALEAIEAKRAADRRAQLFLRLKEAIFRLSQARNRDSTRVKNYEVAEEVISERSDQLFKDLVNT